MARLLISLMMMTIFFDFSSPFPDRGIKRHADGLFTSELSKIKNDVAMRSFLKSLLSTKRSVSEMGFPDNIEDNKTSSEESCYDYLYQNLLSKSFSDQDSAQQIYKFICQPLGYLLQSLQEYVLHVKSMDI